MPQASGFTRLGSLMSVVGAVLTVIALFFPVLTSRSINSSRFPDPYPSTISGVWLIRSIFFPSSSQMRTSTVALLFALLIVLALIVLGTSLPTWLSHANVSGVVSWIRVLAAFIGLIVLLWFLEGVALVNFHVFGPPGPIFLDIGFGIAFPVLGAVLSALGSGRIGIGAAVGTGIGLICLFTPLALVTILVGTITCILGALVGWWIQRASPKSTPIVSS